MKTKQTHFLILGILLFALASIIVVFLSLKNETLKEFESIKKNENVLIEENTMLKNTLKELEANYNKQKEELTQLMFADQREKELKDGARMVAQKFNLTIPWSKIVLSDENSSVTITDPNIIAAANYLFYIRDDVTGYYDNMGKSLYLWTYELYNASEEKISFSTYYEPIIGFEDVPDHLFSTSYDINQLGRAFLSKAKGSPEESTLNKLLNSGLMSIEEENSNSKPFFTFDSYFIKAYTYVLLNSIVPTDEIETSSKLLEIWSYYYFGEEIFVHLYEDYITIEDNGGKDYYLIDDVHQLIQYRTYI